MKILNLYCGLGGNRRLWKGHSITAVEIDPEIATSYQESFPADKVIIGDAHSFLEDHYRQFDFIWSSPPCRTHSRLNIAAKRKRYSDMRLYEEIVLLREFSPSGLLWVVENTIPFYGPLIQPSFRSGRHLFWSNFRFNFPSRLIPRRRFTNIVHASMADLRHQNGNHSYAGPHADQALRNCIQPELGELILKSALKQPIKYGPHSLLG